MFLIFVPKKQKGLGGQYTIMFGMLLLCLDLCKNNSKTINQRARDT
jgi:hypothetical protein